MKLIFQVNNHKLQNSLANWTASYKWVEDWDWFVNESKEFLYHKQLSSHRRYYIEYLEQEERPSENLIRVNVCERTLHISVETYCGKQSIQRRLEEPTTSLGSIIISTLKIDWFMKDVQTSTTTIHLRDSIINGTAIAVRDGSFFPLEKVGSCAWIVSSPDGAEWIQGGGIIPGEDAEQNSYRSELGGALGVAIIMDYIQLPVLPPLSKYNIKFCCDGLSALQIVNTEAVYIKSSGKSVDLISMTSEVWRQSKYELVKEHVYAHQDEDEHYGPLTIESTLNCKADLLAKRFAHTQMRSNQRFIYQHNSLGLGTTICAGKLITSRTQSSMYKIIMNNKLIEKHSDRMNLSVASLYSLVSWEVMAKARKEATLNLKILISKWVSG